MRILAIVLLGVFVFSIAASSITSVPWEEDIVNVIVVYFCQYLMLDLGFCLFALGAMSPPRGGLTLASGFVLALVGSLAATALMFGSILAINLPDIPAFAAFLPFLVAILIEFTHRTLLAANSRGFWIFRLALYFGFLLNSTFVFVSIGSTH
jgi:hypothetical protein